MYSSSRYILPAGCFRYIENPGCPSVKWIDPQSWAFYTHISTFVTVSVISFVRSPLRPANKKSLQSETLTKESTMGGGGGQKSLQHAVYIGSRSRSAVGCTHIDFLVCVGSSTLNSTWIFFDTVNARDCSTSKPRIQCETHWDTILTLGTNKRKSFALWPTITICLSSHTDIVLLRSHTLSCTWLLLFMFWAV